MLTNWKPKICVRRVILRLHIIQTKEKRCVPTTAAQFWGELVPLAHRRQLFGPFPCRSRTDVEAAFLFTQVNTQTACSRLWCSWAPQWGLESGHPGRVSHLELVPNDNFCLIFGWHGASWDFLLGAQCGSCRSQHCLKVSLCSTSCWVFQVLLQVFSQMASFSILSAWNPNWKVSQADVSQAH